MEEDPPPLWLQAIPDREPWRRGRDAICFISLFILLGQSGLIVRSILLASIPLFLLTAGLGGVALFLLYFIWLGHNWPRWIIAPIFACSGFASVVWSMREGSGPLFLFGLLGLTIFTYLGIAPSVYAFARHQRECIRPLEALIVGGICLLVMASVACGLYGFYIYESDLEKQATNFAATAFKQVFLNHNEEFLRANLKDENRAVTPEEFVAQVSESLGQPHWTGKLSGVFRTRWVARSLAMTGLFQFPVLFEGTTPIWINLEVSRIGDGWQIDHIGWEYEPGKFPRSR